jgi:hypothetical protein
MMSNDFYVWAKTGIGESLATEGTIGRGSEEKGREGKGWREIISGPFSGS